MNGPLHTVAAIESDEAFRVAAEDLLQTGLVAEPKLDLHARFALAVWREVKRQGATDVEALTMVYHAGMSHAAEAADIPERELAQKLSAYLTRALGVHA